MAGMSRRSMLKTGTGAALGAGAFAAAGFSIGIGRAETADRSFLDDYYEGAMRILTGLRDTQTPAIEREMATAYERTKKGGTMYSQITAGHFPTDETALDRTGNPGVFAFLERAAKDDVYARLKPDDMIVTNIIHLGNIAAMKRGIRVLGVTVNYFPFAQTPPEEGYQIPYEGKILTIESASSAVIDSQAPWYNGLVKARQNPGFAIIPGGGIAQGAVYWMAAAELAALKATKGKGPLGAARFYIDACIDRAQMVKCDRPKFEGVGKRCADLVIKGGKWWVAGARALISDASGVANGPMVTRPYNAGQVKKDDIVLIASYDSNNPADLAVAKDSRAKGAFTIAIAPFSTGTDASGPRLYKEVDTAFDTHSPDEWGAVPVKGLERRVCPTSGVIADLVMWLLVAEWTDVMANRDLFPYFWKGIFMKNGTEYNTATRPLFEARGW